MPQSCVERGCTLTEYCTSQATVPVRDYMYNNSERKTNRNFRASVKMECVPIYATSNGDKTSQFYAVCGSLSLVTSSYGFERFSGMHLLPNWFEKEHQKKITVSVESQMLSLDAHFRGHMILRSSTKKAKRHLTVDCGVGETRGNTWKVRSGSGKLTGQTRVYDTWVRGKSAAHHDSWKLEIHRS